MSFQAMESGAVAVVPKAAGRSFPDSTAQSQELIQMVKLMAEVKVVRRWSRRAGSAGSATVAQAALGPYVYSFHRRCQTAVSASAAYEAILIGASTGGPLPIRTILSALPPDIPAAVLIVSTSPRASEPASPSGWRAPLGFPSASPADGEIVMPGHVYIAPDDAHMGVRRGRASSSATANRRTGCVLPSPTFFAPPRKCSEREPWASSYRAWAGMAQGS